MSWKCGARWQLISRLYYCHQFSKASVLNDWIRLVINRHHARYGLRDASSPDIVTGEFSCLRKDAVQFWLFGIITMFLQNDNAKTVWVSWQAKGRPLEGRGHRHGSVEISKFLEWKIFILPHFRIHWFCFIDWMDKESCSSTRPLTRDESSWLVFLSRY